MVFRTVNWVKNLLYPDNLLSGCGYQCFTFKTEEDSKLDSLYERLFRVVFYCFVGFFFYKT